MKHYEKFFLVLVFVFIIGIIAFFATQNDTIRNYLKLFNLILLFVIWYSYSLTANKIVIMETGIQVGTKLISITDIISIKIYEDFIRLGGTYRTDPQTWKKYVQIKFRTKAEGDEITRRIDDTQDIEEKLEEWALGKNLKYTRVPRGQAY